MFETALIMGIMNLTPDSFFKNSRVSSETTFLTRAEEMLKAGADIIDLGAYSSRPGAKDVSEQSEWLRLEKFLKVLRSEFPELLISVDSFRSKIAKRAVENGADIINDISGGDLDTNMLDTIASLNVPYVLMHMHGKPQNMQDHPYGQEAVQKVYHYFSKKINTCHSLGIKDVILDPGFGFGKTLEGNYLLLKSLAEFTKFNCPILAGISRKSMVNKVINDLPENSIEATIAANTIALLNGASILRVHDVKAAKDTSQIVSYYQKM